MKIAVYGATGYTGTLVAQELKKASYDVRLVARDASRVESLGQELEIKDCRGADVHKPEELASAFDGCDLVVNAAGPFIRLGYGVIEACIKSAIDYVDICGEQAYLKAAYERYDTRAREAGIAIVNGLAFEVALADWGANVAANELSEDLKSLEVIYLLRGSRPTQGTLLSIFEALGRDGWVWRRGLWDPIAPGAERKHFSLDEATRSALSIPGGEIISIPRHVDVEYVQAYISLTDSPMVNRGLGLIGRVLPFFAQTPALSQARSIVFRKRRMPSEEERKGITFALIVEAQGDQRCELVLRGRDIYGISAAIVATALKHRLGSHTGVISPSQYCAPKACIDELSDQDLLEVSSSVS